MEGVYLKGNEALNAPDLLALVCCLILLAVVTTLIFLLDEDDTVGVI